MRTANTAINIILYLMIFNASYATPANNQATARDWQCHSDYKNKDRKCGKTSNSRLQAINGEFAVAFSLMRDKKYKEAINIYLPLAKGGNMGAQFNLAGMYGRGDGVLIDHEYSFSWYKKAAIQGHDLSQYSLGIMYMKGEGIPKDAKKGFYWTKQSAENGNKLAQAHLAMLYALGDGTAKDHNKAFTWHKKAAEQGVITSQYYVAWYYCIGFDAAPRNLQACAIWAKKAQRNGSKKASELWEKYELWKY